MPSKLPVTRLDTLYYTDTVINSFLQIDASAVNLRLQYSSYFLFVLVITCVLYGMIKGRPGKQNFSKKVGIMVSSFQTRWIKCLAQEVWHQLAPSHRKQFTGEIVTSPNTYCNTWAKRASGLRTNGKRQNSSSESGNTEFVPETALWTETA